MMRALYSSVSGLKTHQTKMDVIGNNISNVNTVGFKSSRTTFSTMMYQTTSFASGANAATGKGGVNSKQIGLGVNFASTAVDIDTGGASESTGKAFDLKLSDKNSTSFYIVNTGTENVFTRAGAFYVDGAGNLCMESTGYTVMGWQVDANGNIVKDTVSPLKIMAAGNQTSQPEYTTDAVCTGILDDTNTNVNSDRGYTMTLNFFDNLGYPYTARFAAQKTGGDGQYTINLTDVIDSRGNSVISGTDIELSQLFGSGSAQGSQVDVTDNYTMQSGMTGALRKLATTKVTNPHDAAATGENFLLYRFPSETVNQYLGTNNLQLPSGLTVEFAVDMTNEASPAAVEGSVLIRDANGYDVTDTYISTGTGADAVPGMVDETKTNITKTETAKERIERWNSLNQLKTVKETVDGATVTHYLLKSGQLEQLKADFPTVNTALQSISDFSSMQVEVVFNASGEITGINAYPATNTDTNTATVVGALTAGGANASGVTRTESLLDYLGQGYLTVTAAQANQQNIFTTPLPNDLEIRFKEDDGSYTIVTPTGDGFTAQFSTADGSLQYIGAEGSTVQTLQMSLITRDGDNPTPFSDIQIDFSTLKNLANGANCTAAMSPGNPDKEDPGSGKKVGTMIGLSVDQSGKIFGSYSNGNTALLGQIAVARFANASGLESIGENCYKTTMNSGEFDGIGVEMDSDGSTIDSGTLEMSNVDLATEFTQMITTQRGYQANSRVISTSDSILEELVNLKR